MFCPSVVVEVEFGTAHIFYHCDNGESALQYNILFIRIFDEWQLQALSQLTI